ASTGRRGSTTITFDRSGPALAARTRIHVQRAQSCRSCTTPRGGVVRCCSSRGSPSCSPWLDRPHGSLDGLSRDNGCDRLEQPANAAPRRLPIVHFVDDHPKHRGLSIIGALW